jgi:hypothetical protein
MGFVPVQINTDLTNGTKRALSQPFFHYGQFFRVIFFDRARMDAHHRKTLPRIVFFHLQHALNRGVVYIRKEKTVNPAFHSPLHHLCPVSIKFPGVQVRVCVYQPHVFILCSVNAAKVKIQNEGFLVGSRKIYLNSMPAIPKYKV